MTWAGVLDATSALGSRVRTYRSLDSTNAEALRQADAGAPCGTVVIADEQTAGRGRAGRAWFSPAGTSVHLSVLRRPSLATDRLSSLTLDVAVAVSRTLEECAGISPRLKWPNDLLLNGQKCCGILTELRTHGREVAVVIGVGIDVHELPPGAPPVATSVEAHTARELTRGEVVRTLIRQLDASYAAFIRRRGFDRDAWTARAILDVPVEVAPPGQARYRGRAIGVTDAGLLMVATPAGTREVVAGDVTLLKGEG